MTVDQDLSGDMVKVVQFCIVSIATNEVDNAKMLFGPKTIVFADDMTAADFTSWILSEYRADVTENVPYIRKSLDSSGKVDFMKLAAFKALKAWGIKHTDSSPKNSNPKTSQPAALGGRPDDPLLNPKWHRVAFHVISRFAPVDIDWNQAQAQFLGQLARNLTPPIGVQAASQSFDFKMDQGESKTITVTNPPEKNTATNPPDKNGKS